MDQTSRGFKTKLHMIIIMNQIPFIYITCYSTTPKVCTICKFCMMFDNNIYSHEFFKLIKNNYHLIESQHIPITNWFYKYL